MKFYIEYTGKTDDSVTEKPEFWKYWKVGISLDLNFNKCSFKLPKPNKYWRERRIPNKKLTGIHRFSITVHFCSWSGQLTGYDEKVS